MENTISTMDQKERETLANDIIMSLSRLTWEEQNTLICDIVSIIETKRTKEMDELKSNLEYKIQYQRIIPIRGE